MYLFYTLWWRALGQHTIEVVNKHTLVCASDLSSDLGPAAREQMSTHTWQTNTPQGCWCLSARIHWWLVALTLGEIFIEVTPLTVRQKFQRTSTNNYFECK